MRTVTVEEAIQVLTDAAFLVDDPELQDHGRILIHTQRGMFGADWDLAGAIEEVKQADVVFWNTHFDGHNLSASKDGRTVRFDVREPLPDR